MEFNKILKRPILRHNSIRYLQNYQKLQSQYWLKDNTNSKQSLSFQDLITRFYDDSKRNISQDIVYQNSTFDKQQYTKQIKPKETESAQQIRRPIFQRIRNSVVRQKTQQFDEENFTKLQKFVGLQEELNTLRNEDSFVEEKGKRAISIDIPRIPTFKDQFKLPEISQKANQLFKQINSCQSKTPQQQSAQKFDFTDVKKLPRNKEGSPLKIQPIYSFFTRQRQRSKLELKKIVDIGARLQNQQQSMHKLNFKLRTNKSSLRHPYPSLKRYKLQKS